MPVDNRNNIGYLLFDSTNIVNSSQYSKQYLPAKCLKISKTKILLVVLERFETKIFVNWSRRYTASWKNFPLRIVRIFAKY